MGLFTITLNIVNYIKKYKKLLDRFFGVRKKVRKKFMGV